MGDAMTDIEGKIVETWKDKWNGAETYANALTYLAFVFVGFGLGSIFTVRKLILENPQFLTDALAAQTQTAIQISMSVATIGFVVCSLLSLWIEFRFGDT